MHNCCKEHPIPFIPAAQGISTAPNPEKLSQAMRQMDELLAVTPVELVLSWASQLRDITEQHLIDTVRDDLDRLPSRIVRICETALDDLDSLCCPALPAPVLSAEALHCLHDSESIDSLEEYHMVRSELHKQLQALDAAEREAVSGHIHRKLIALLIRLAVPELVYQKRDPVLNRQYDLWTQTEYCRGHGLESLVPYFLKANENAVRVLLPAAMPPHNSAEDYYACARTLAILFYQIPVCQREALFQGLLSAFEYEVTNAVAYNRSDTETEAIRDLYLAMQAEEHTGFLRYWQADCYIKHAVTQNEEEN